MVGAKLSPRDLEQRPRRRCAMFSLKSLATSTADESRLHVDAHLLTERAVIVEVDISTVPGESRFGSS